jgi:hypothetical protein
MNPDRRGDTIETATTNRAITKIISIKVKPCRREFFGP